MGGEQKLNAQIAARIKSLRKQGVSIWSFKIHGGPMQQAGVPDIVIVCNGKTVWLELKTPHGKVSALQRATINRMEAAGAVVFVIDAIEQFDCIVEKLLLLEQANAYG